MARRKYPFKLVSDLDRLIRLKQAQVALDTGRNITLQELYKEIADYMGVTVNTISLIKSGNYNPSIVVALALAEYLEVPVTEIFSIERIAASSDVQ